MFIVSMCFFFYYIHFDHFRFSSVVPSRNDLNVYLLNQANRRGMLGLVVQFDNHFLQKLLVLE